MKTKPIIRNFLSRAAMTLGGRQAVTLAGVMTKRFTVMITLLLMMATAWAVKPDKSLDECTGGANIIHVQGWAYDPDASTVSIGVHVYVYTDAGCTSQYGNIHVLTANVSRPDVNSARNITGNHGFNADIAIADTGNYWVKVFAIDTNGDGNPQIGSTTAVTVTAAAHSDGVKTLPYTYDFENNDLAAEGWTVVDCTENASNITDHYHHSGNYCFEFGYHWDWTDEEQKEKYLISPEIDSKGNDFTVSFHYTIQDCNNTSFQVGYSTTTNEPSAFTWDDAISGDCGWTLYEKEFSVGTKYIAIKVNNLKEGDVGVMVDDFIFNMSGCLPPTNVTMSEMSSGTITLNWSAPTANRVITGYTYQYKKTSETEWSAEATVTQTTTTATLNNLEANTTYDFRVKTNYEGGLSSYYATITIILTSLPFVENFENGLGCWQIVNGDVDHTGIEAPYHQSNAFCFWGDGPQYLISPQFNCTANITVSFKYNIDASDNPKTFQVGYSTTTYDTSAFTWDNTETTATSYDYAEYKNTFPAGTKYVAVKYTSNSTAHLFIDDFVIRKEDVVPPTEISACNISTQSATLTWMAPETTNTITGYAYQFKKTSESTWSDEVTTTETSATISNLTGDTDYEFRVKTLYGSDTSTYATFSFTTATPLPYEQGFENGIGRWGRVDINWGYTEISADAKHDGEKGFKFRHFPIDPKPQYIISPCFTNDVDFTVLFYYRTDNTSTAERFQVGYSTTTSDVGAFTWGDEISVICDYFIRENGGIFYQIPIVSWSLYENTFPAGTKYIAVKYTSNVDALYLDDFSFLVYYGPKPTSLAVGNCTEQAATLTWMAPETTNTITGYTYQYKKTSESTWSDETTTTVTSATISSLTADTEYEFRVKTLYGSNASTYAYINFTTDTSLPYEQGFENGIGQWSTVDINLLGIPHTGISTDAKHDGEKGFKFQHYPTDPKPQYLISPRFPDNTAFTVLFYYRTDNTNTVEKFQVGYSTTTSDVGAFTWDDEISVICDYSLWEDGGIFYQNRIVSWSLYEKIFPAGTKYIAVKYTSNGDALYLDDFSSLVYYGPKPTSLAVGNCTEQAATLTWTAPETTNTITGYAYQYKKTSESTWSDEVTTTETSATISSLTAGTEYEFRVKTLYGSNASIYAYINFTTDTSLPYKQGFENGMGQWSTVDINLWEIPNTGISTDAKHDGETGFRFQHFPTDPKPQYLISPRLADNAPITVLFNYRTYSTSTAERFQVGYSTTTSDVGAFTWGDEISVICDYSLREDGDRIYLTPIVSWSLYDNNFPAGTKYIAVKYTSNLTALYLDDFSFLVYNGPKPTGLAVGSCTEQTATLTWMAPETTNTITGYAYQYKKTSESTWSDEVTTTETSATISNLTADTDYEFRVKTLYGSNASTYAYINFTTATPLPYKQGFENGMGRWDTVDINLWGIPRTGISTDAKHDGETGFRFQNLSNPKPQYLISPRFADNAPITVLFNYRTYNTSTAERFQVGYSTTTSDVGAFTWDDEISVICDYSFREDGDRIYLTPIVSWSLYEKTFPAGTKYIAVKYTSNLKALYLDDFSFMTYSGPKPTGLAVGNCTEQTATLTWTAPETTNTITGYAYQYKKTSESTWSDETITTGTSATISNLTADTNYEFRVKTLYGSGASLYATSSFTTVTPLPYDQGFENDMGHWSMVDCACDGDVHIYENLGYNGSSGRRTQAAHDGDVGFMFGCYGEGNKIPQYLISPRFGGDVSMKVSFYCRIPRNISETIEVCYSTTTNDKDAFTTVYTLTISSNNWIRYEIKVPAATRYIALKYTSNNFQLYIDDFCIEEYSTYATPTTVEVTNITETEATVSWNVSDGTTGYAYQYKKASDSTWSDGETENTTITLSRLTPNTNYNFRLKALYGSNASNYFFINFRTEGNMVDLPYTDGFENGMGCWRMENCVGSTNIVQATNPHSGTYSFLFYDADKNQYLISPHFAGGMPIKVSFYYKNYENSPAVFAVGYTSSKEGDITWGNQITTSSGAWTLYETTLPAETQYVIICCRKEGDMLYIDDFSVTPVIGDANGDGKVDAADIVEMVNAMNGNVSTNFNWDNADFDGNHTITDYDINEVVKIIMGE